MSSHLVVNPQYIRGLINSAEAQADAGVYTVEVHDANSAAQSASAELTVTSALPLESGALLALGGMLFLLGGRRAKARRR